MNAVMLVGKALEDSVVSTSKNGMEYVNFKVVIPKGKDVNGNYMRDIIGVYFWDKRAKYIAEWIHKGDTVAVEGRIGVKDDHSYVINGTKVQKLLNNKPKEEVEETTLEDLGF